MGTCTICDRGSAKNQVELFIGKEAIRLMLLENRDKLGVYQHQSLRFDNKVREVRDITTLPNGDVYKGEWDAEAN